MMLPIKHPPPSPQIVDVEGLEHLNQFIEQAELRLIADCFHASLQELFSQETKEPD
ncbi:MAG: hypothetical protein OEL57_13750 [Trichlorobacter sp.]|uniref:hypothetical protein n=1 Tax=Trichlorobacter sp. TaxID=2911007 RepID=UPI00256B5940|nr:hypothetical protein [Trichlorobacter sp.]MDK9718947.1 hypothetical protein [Trichlorobacter sp.]